jgi:hypothetical protein
MMTNFPASYIPTASVPIAVSAAGIVQLVAAVSGKAIYVIGWDVVGGGTRTFALEYGTDANSATGTTALPAHTPQRLSSAGLAWATSSFPPAKHSAP